MNKLRTQPVILAIDAFLESVCHIPVLRSVVEQSYLDTFTQLTRVSESSMKTGQIYLMEQKSGDQVSLLPNVLNGYNSVMCNSQVARRKRSI